MSVYGSMNDVRFPRSMIANEASERLLQFLGVRIVDDCDAELEDFARAWLATTPQRNRAHRADLPATEAVVAALARMDERRRAA